MLSLGLVFAQCANKPYGKKVKEPFQGSSYESNNRFFRATGKGTSNSENVARGKADIQAKSQLAGQVNTTMKQVSDQYMSQNENARAADLSEKFESLIRQVVNTQIADLRKIGEEKYYNGADYTVFIAYEIKKNAMFRFLKKQAKADKRFNEAERKAIEEMIDEELKKLEE
jgi:histone acetyltransferase (RNA polymerase elongator complex component)